MSREIKFRAWHIKEKYMTEVVGMWHREVHPNGYISDLNHVNIRTKYGNSQVAKHKNGEYFEVCLDNEVEVMQYTNLEDKNGVEIYEGDIAKTFDGDIYEVVWQDAGFYVLLDGNVLTQLWEVSDDIEVIGNIYENMDLLDG